MKKRLAISMFVAVLCQLASANIVTSEPSPLQQGSSNVVLVYNSAAGNAQLANLPQGTSVYAHIGVITNKSNGEWSHAPAWGDNSAKYQLKREDTNTWTLAIGDINTYFGITDPNEIVYSLAMVMRTANCSLEGKTATGGDIILDVLPEGFAMQFRSDAPFVLTATSPSVNFDVATTAPAQISLHRNSIDTAPFAQISNATKLSSTETFAPGSDNMVIARAIDNQGKCLLDTLYICYPMPSPAITIDEAPQQGATTNTDGSVTFCLAAPSKENAMIIGQWNDFHPTVSSVMNRVDTPDGITYFTIDVSGLTPGKNYAYYYLVDNSLRVGDPYAHLVLDPFNDRYIDDGTYPGMPTYPHNEVGANVMLAVYNSDIDNYDWQIENFVGPDPQNLIIYELLLRDFTGTEGQARGNGTLAQAMEKIDYLKKLGVNAIELMPVQEFNGNNSWGYNTNFYFAPDKAYGSPEQYRQFIDLCHANGMAVILDVVFNQSDGMHPWYQMYPTNSNPFYNQRAPHAYSVLNDWNQDNLLVRRQWIDMIKYWMIAYKVDGFRFDLVKGLGNNESYGGNASEANTNRYNASRVAHMKQLTEAMHAINPKAYSINENLAGTQEENEMAANGQLNWANINEQACQFAMGYSSDSDCNRFYAPLDGGRTWGSTVSYAESHDEQRVAYKQIQWGATAVKRSLELQMRRLGSMAAQMILTPGAHMIWQFGELGNATSTKNSDGSNNTDPKPVLWNYLDNPYRHGLYDTYCRLIQLRLDNASLFEQSSSFTINCSSANWSRGRTIIASDGKGSELICVINPNTGTVNSTFSSIPFSLTSNTDYEVLAASYNTTPIFNVANRTVTLAPGAFVVLGSTNLYAGIEDVAVDNNNNFTVDHNTITSVGNNPVEVYSISGALLSTLSNSQSINLNPGIYIVKSANTTNKIAITR